MGSKLRLFWAVNLPADLKARLAKLQLRLQPAGGEAKWVEENNLHLTLKFLGETDRTLVDPIVSAAAAALAESSIFKLDLEGLGFFPNAARPRVIWAGVRGRVDLLLDLAGRVDRAMVGLGFRPEERKFSPHLTLARIKQAGPPGQLAGAAASLAAGGLHQGSFMVRSADLMESRLSGSGPVYLRLAQVNLKD